MPDRLKALLDFSRFDGEFMTPSMSFQSKTYRVSFTLNGKNMWEIVTAWSSSAAREVSEERFRGGTRMVAYYESFPRDSGVHE
jgi:hypothetical protein